LRCRFPHYLDYQAGGRKKEASAVKKFQNFPIQNFKILGVACEKSSHLSSILPIYERFPRFV
jgi:hypothetical protein